MKTKCVELTHRCELYYTAYWGSSVSIVSDYTLDDRVSIPGRGKDFPSSLCAQTSSEAHPASYIMGTVGSFPGLSAAGA
jgi:hypothetical protein